MIKQITIHPEDRIDTNMVDDLSEIDLIKDAIICCKYSNELNKMSKQEVFFDIDQFTVNSLEVNRPKKHPTKILYDFFPRIKITLPNGIFPQYSCILPGLKINNFKYEKQTGIEFEQEIKLIDRIINIKGEKGRYSLYGSPSFELIENDHIKFTSENNFMGFRIPIGQQIFSLRLLWQFIGQNTDLKNIYLICSSYIYDRLPNF